MTKTFVAIRYGAVFTAVGVGLTLFSGCHGSGAPTQAPRENNPTTQAVRTPTTGPAGDQVLATVNGLPITREELDQPLIESFGLPMLLNIVQLKLAEQQLEKTGQHVSPEDVQNERRITFSNMFADAAPEDYDNLLGQFLRQQNLSRPEFDMVIETNANLRKLAQPHLAGAISDEMVHQAFGQLYGENRQIRDIEVSNIPEWTQAKRRVDAGKPFEKVAGEMSRDPQTRSLGGELPPFSAQAPNIPSQIKTIAFSLQLGQVSDIVQDGSAYHLIKLVNIIPPKIVKFEDVRDSVRKTLEEQWMQLAIKDVRNQLGQITLRTLKVQDPALLAQWQAKLDQQTNSERDRDAIRNDIKRHRQQLATMPTTGPTTLPAPPTPVTPAAAAPTTAGRPPATQPGAIAPGGK